jgi:hypothetical protein
MGLKKDASLEALLGLGRTLDAAQARGDWDEVIAVTANNLRVRDKNGRRVSLTANEVQREYLRRCGHRNIVLKARQLGMTTWVAAGFFLRTITHPGTLTVQVAHDQESAEEIFRIVHRFLETLPETLQRNPLLQTSRANVRQLVFPRIDCEYRVETAADPNAGRGLTIQNLHCSEVARWPRDGAEVLASLRAAVPPHGAVILESTPNGAGGVFYDAWQRAEETGYTRHFFPWWMERKYAREGGGRFSLTDEEEQLMRRHGLSRAQIAFRREIRANFRGLARQEYAEDASSCFLESGECVFDLEALAKRCAELPKPASSRENGRLLTWLPAKAGSEYVVGADPAGGGVDGDFACAQVIERRTGLQCAELHGHCTPSELASRIASLGREYGDALVAVERNNHGHAVLAHLTTSCEYPNLYKQGGQLGWLTSAASRPPMIENFGAILAATPELFSSERLLNECRTFVRNAGGVPAAASGAHDDCVMAMAIALAVRREG